MKYVLIIASCLLCCAGVSQLDEQKKGYLNNAFQAFHGRNPGVAIGIVEDGKLSYHFTAGYGNISKNEEITLDSRFNVASLVKQCVGYSLLKSDEIVTSDNVFELLAWDVPLRVSVENILKQQSGFPDAHTFWQLKGNLLNEVLEGEQLEEFVSAFGLTYAPGTKTVYSNVGFGLLYELLRSKEIKLVCNGAWESSRLLGYSVDGKKFKPVSRLTGVKGSSNFYSSLTEYSKFMIQVLSDKKFINRLEGSAPYYAGFIVKNQDEIVLEHGGIENGHRAFVRYFPERNTGIVVFTNSNYLDAEYYVDFVEKVLFETSPKPFRLKGIIADNDTKAAIPYARIHIKRNYGGLLSDSLGRFHIQTSEVDGSVSFSAPGYQKIEQEEWGDTVFLEKLEVHEGRDGFKVQYFRDYEKPFSFVPWVSESGVQLIRKIPCGEGPVSLHHVRAFITDQGVPTQPVRLVVYDSDGENSLPGTELTQSVQIGQVSEGNQWLTFHSNWHLQPHGDYIYVGIELLTAPGSKGKNAPFVGFIPYQNSNDSYYRVPGDHWRRVGESMYRGNQDLMIEARVSNGARYDMTESLYFYDSTYASVFPYTFAHNRIFVQPYPLSRELSLEPDAINAWGDDNAGWTIEMNLDDDGYTGLLAIESQPIRTLESHNLEESDLPKMKSEKLKYKSLSLKVKHKKDKLIVKPSWFRKWVFTYYGDGFWYLVGDLSYQRLIRTETEGNRITSLKYSDVRTPGIEFKP